MPEDKTQDPFTTEKTTELKPCRICGGNAWWRSVRGVVTCGICHPPATPNPVK